LSVTGKPDELDRELSEQLGAFGGSVIKTGSNLDELRTQHAAAVKALEAENKKKLNEKRKADGSKATSTTASAGRDWRNWRVSFSNLLLIVSSP